MKAGTLVGIKPEWRDGPSDAQPFITTDHADKGRVTIAPLHWSDTQGRLRPSQTVTLEMIEQAS